MEPYPPPEDSAASAPVARTSDVVAAIPVLTLVVFALIVQATGPGFDAVLRYERDALLGGEWWRLVTGNLVHLGPAHLVLNLAGLALIVMLFRGRFTAVDWSVVLLASGLATTLGLLAFHPQIAWYVGLSGILHGAFTAGAVTDLRRGKRGAWIYLLLLGAKLLGEFIWGASAQTTLMIGGPVVVAAHAYGAAGGLAALAWRRQAAR